MPRSPRSPKNGSPQKKAKIGPTRVLVTGGGGFVGSHICKRLVAADDGKKFHVICMDNFFTGHKKNIQDLVGKPNFELVEHDIEKEIPLDDVDQIYNMACPAAPGHYQYNPLRTLRTAIDGVWSCMELAKKCNARILQASTSEVYGEPLVHPQTEDYRGNVNCIGPRSCYDEGKRVGETIMFDYKRMYNIDIKIIRIFNTYGPNMHPYDGRVVSNFIRQAVTDTDITIYGDGKQTRSFQFVDDFVEGIYRMMNDSPADFTGPVNLGNPVELTISELATKIVELAGSKSKITYKPAPADDPTQRKPDISLAAEKLNGWKPSIQVAEGLAKTIKYMKTLNFEEFVPPTPLVYTSVEGQATGFK